MALVAGYKVVGSGGVRAFEKLVVVGILRNSQHERRGDELCAVLYELEKLLAEAFADFEFRACENLPIFCEDGFRDVERGRFDDREQEHGTLESVWLQGSRHEDIGVDDEPERNHCRFDFWARVALMTRSIWRELSLCVPWCRDSAPISLSTSGSGAASRT